MLILWIVFSTCPAVVRATETPDSSFFLTLQQAVGLALDHQPSITAAEAQVRLSSASFTQAQSLFYPSLTISATGSRTDGAFVFNPSFPSRNQSYNNYTTTLQIQQTLLDVGRMVNRTSALSSLRDASTYQLEGSRENVILNVQLSYYTHVQSLRLVAVSEEAVRMADEHLRQAQAFYTVGRRPRSDVTKAEVDLANARVNLIHAKSQAHITSVQLENAMGFHPETPFAVRDTFDVEAYSLSGDSSVTFALLHRPELLAATATASANRALAAAAWAQHLPTLTAFGNWTWSNFDFPLYSRWNAGVTLSVPVFQGFSIDAQADQAKAGAEIAQAAVEQLRESITLEVQQAFWALQEGRERTVATRKLVQQATENLTLAEKQYAAGVATPLDVSDAQLALSNARTTDIQAQYDTSSSLARLRKAMGVLTVPE
jgi:outer membrane protein